MAVTELPGVPSAASAVTANGCWPGTGGVAGSAAGPGRCASTNRRPGRNEPRSLVAVCRACHARLHRRHQLPGWAPPLLSTLWKEQHRGWPVQLPLAFELSAGAAA